MDYVLWAIGLGVVGCVVGGAIVLGMMRVYETLIERHARREMLEQEKETRAEQEAKEKQRASLRVISGSRGESH